MKRLLLDSHVFLWWLVDAPNLGNQTKGIISDPRNEVYISAATTWEISIKVALGKLTAPTDVSSIIEQEQFIELPISAYHGDQAGQLPPIHRDPFDRMLIAQAQAEGLILVTHDNAIKNYTVRVFDATV